MSIVRAPRPISNYFQVHNDTARDENLSYRARGILLRILSNEDNFKMDATALAKSGKEGRGAILSALKELRESRYAILNKFQRPNGQWVTEVTVYDTPQPKKVTEVGKPNVGKRDVGSLDGNKKDNIPSFPSSKKNAYTPKVPELVGGIVCWEPRDIERATKAIKDFGLEAVMKASNEVAAQRSEPPLCSRVLNQLTLNLKLKKEDAHGNAKTRPNYTSKSSGESKNKGSRAEHDDDAYYKIY